MIFMVIGDDFDLKSKTYIKIENELQYRDSGRGGMSPGRPEVPDRRSTWEDAGTLLTELFLICAATFFSTPLAVIYQ